MNFANVVEYDYENRNFRIRPPEPSQWARTLGLGPTITPPSSPERQVAPDGSFRRAMRGGGGEIMRVLRSAAGKLMSERAIAKSLPHVHGTTLRVRLCRMTHREDIVRYGERSHYRYGLPGGSTLGTT